MNRTEWMRGEIAAWRSEGVIGEELATALLGRYAPETVKISWGAMLAGAFGALLTGLGIMALFAANWDHFGRGARAAISLAPVVLCGIVAAMTSWKGRRSMFLWEPLGISWCLATVAAICLVAQTYNVGGSVPGLILFVSLLCLPIVWITRAIVPMALWPVFAIVWAGASAETDGRSWMLVFEALGLMSLSLPAYVAFVRRKPGKTAWITGQLATGMVYALGTAILIVVTMPRASWHVGDIGVVVFWACSAVVLSAGIRFKLSVWPTVATLVAAGAAMATVFATSLTYALALVLAVAIAGHGVRRTSLKYMNVGAALLLWLVLVKFFESRVDFTVKGLVLIGAGVALTVLNVAMLRFKRRSASK